MGEKVPVSVRVDESRKERWKSHIEETGEAASLSHLVRIAVEGHIGDDSGGREGVSSAIDDGRLDEVIQSINQLQREVSDVSDRLTTIENEVTDDESPLQVRVKNALPPAEPHTEPWKRARAGEPSVDQGGGVAWSGTFEDIVAAVDEPESDVEEVLDYLRNSPSFGEAVIDGEHRYWLDTSRNIDITWERRGGVNDG